MIEKNDEDDDDEEEIEGWKKRLMRNLLVRSNDEFH